MFYLRINIVKKGLILLHLLTCDRFILSDKLFRNIRIFVNEHHVEYHV